LYHHSGGAWGDDELSQREARTRRCLARTGGLAFGLLVSLSVLRDILRANASKRNPESRRPHTEFLPHLPEESGWYWVVYGPDDWNPDTVWIECRQTPDGVQRYWAYDREDDLKPFDTDESVRRGDLWCPDEGGAGPTPIDVYRESRGS